MDRKVLGILGGMGPLATAHFFQGILKWTKAEKDWDHLRVIIDNNVDIPSRTRALLYGEESPVQAMRQACFALMDIGCDYIAVPCNSAHSFYNEVIKDTDIPWANMIRIVAEALTNYKNVLILGGYSTIHNRTYDEYADNTIYFKDNSLVYAIIEDTKVNTADHTRLNCLYKNINDLNVDCVLLGCTELPMMFEKDKVNCEVVDGNEIYIKELIKMCGGTVKYE